MRRLLALPLMFFAEDALACGGFFCSQVPVLQTAERIIFELDGDQVTAYVQLQYQGNDPNFAWIVPVPEAPQVEVGVGQNMFDVLEDETRPVFVGSSQNAAPAAPAIDLGQGCGGGFGSFSREPELMGRYLPVPNVDVWQDEQVGPYDVVTLSANDAEDLNNWLLANGYRVVPGSEPIVQEYLDAGMKLLALKLSPTAEATAVEPIKMTYRDTRGCAAIPVKLTAIAAVPGLEIITWVFSESRAAPRNFREIAFDSRELFNANDYLAQVSAQVDEAGGHAFVTEFAGKSEEISSQGDPILQDLLQKHGYVTRMRSELDPDEMTVDPEFDVNFQEGDVARTVELAPGPTRMGTGAFLLLTLAMIVVMRRRS